MRYWSILSLKDWSLTPRFYLIQLQVVRLLRRHRATLKEWRRNETCDSETAGMLKVDAVTTLTTNITTMKNMMNTHFSNLALGQQLVQVNAVQQPLSWCEICGGSDHSAENSRPQGGVPSNTDPNSKQVNAVGTRSGLQLEELDPKKRNTNTVTKESEPKEGKVFAQEERVQPIVKPPPLFPQKFKKQKEYECFGKFLSLFKHVYINLPLVVVLLGIPSINLMRTSLYKKLGLGSPKPTTIILQLADRFVARHKGVVEDVLVGIIDFPSRFCCAKL
ncbi:hypothetical protein R3W88_026802 [Solanum pinnatisectum]|uniref:Uncharacterized protein n=1 Tax=Solanum pinnatisectum TaxID=50273 RepID=A0AAV9LEX7_9SOLN|nr:hypothetical protein R3W88_026802 [Solanum pinnatisectum]